MVFEWFEEDGMGRQQDDVEKILTLPLENNT